MLHHITIPLDDYNQKEQIVVLDNIERFDVGFRDYFNIIFFYNSGRAVEYNLADEPTRDAEALVIKAIMDACCPPAGSGDIYNVTFETVSKNLESSDVVSSDATSMTYANGVVKTITEPDEDTIIVVLSGTTPAGISLTKTVSFAGDDYPTIAYT